METHSLYWRFSRFLERHLPAGLYKRALIIVIAPIVLLQAIMAGIILDRHWDQVTRVLSRSLSRDISLIIELYDRSAKTPPARAELEDLAGILKLEMAIRQGETLPAPLPAPLFSPLDTRLTRYLANDVERPFWLDTGGRPGYVDIRVEAEPGVVFHILARDERAAATGTGAFLILTMLSSLVLAAIAVAFLRNQIEPILQLAQAARSFGLGRGVGDFHARGATEVREAALAFLNMKERIERHVEQRTALLAGVSHDLRTVLTRFNLELALLGPGPRVDALKEDVAEMQKMLEAYLAFARGAEAEAAEPVDIVQMLTAVAADQRTTPVTVAAPDGLTARVKPNAFRRLAVNLVGNAARYARTVEVSASATANRLRFTVEDDGPGIAAELREEVFKPFVRLDHARNLDETGTGLGLAIARDIARAHGGDITLGASRLGGLSAVVEIPI